MERSGATSASTTRGGRREDSVPDERAKPKWHFIRFLPPLADIKLNLFQFDLSRVTARDTFSVIRWFYEEEDLSIVRSKFNFKKLILVENGKILSLGEIYTHIWEYFVEICAIFVRSFIFLKKIFLSQIDSVDGFNCETKNGKIDLWFAGNFEEVEERSQLYLFTDFMSNSRFKRRFDGWPDLKRQASVGTSFVEAVNIISCSMEIRRRLWRKCKEIKGELESVCVFTRCRNAAKSK